MKKYASLFLLFILAIVFINFTSTSPVEAYDSGCTGAGPFSRTTGQPCGTNLGVSGCMQGDLFSRTTGQPCAGVVAAPETTSSFDSFFNRGLGVGSKGADVKLFQKLLVDLGFLSAKADGAYGPVTRAGVVRFQKANGIPATGKFDDATIEALKSIVFTHTAVVH